MVNNKISAVMPGNMKVKAPTAIPRMPTIASHNRAGWWQNCAFRNIPPIPFDAKSPPVCPLDLSLREGRQ
jgi:hypothetical protein